MPAGSVPLHPVLTYVRLRGGSKLMWLAKDQYGHVLDVDEDQTELLRRLTSRVGYEEALTFPLTYVDTAGQSLYALDNQ